MKRGFVALALLLAGCGGTAPAVQSPSTALDNDGVVSRRCIDNAPPAGYRGPVSPYSRSCVPEESAPRVAPAGQHDYSKGQPPRVVR